MPRKPRIDLPDSMHHVAARTNDAAPLFHDFDDRHQFLEVLDETITHHDWRCGAYCLMGTHFHLVIYTVKATLSAGMRRLCGSYAQWFNWRHGRHGHLFGDRFSSRHITVLDHLLEAHRYVALNPVRADHCDDPADWRWGSYRALAGLERPRDFLDVGAVHDLFGSPREYRDFVLSGLQELGSDPSGVRPRHQSPATSRRRNTTYAAARGMLM